MRIITRRNPEGLYDILDSRTGMGIYDVSLLQLAKIEQEIGAERQLEELRLKEMKLKGVES